LREGLAEAARSAPVVVRTDRGAGGIEEGQERIGERAAAPIDPDGNVLSPAAWAAGVDRWLPSATDRAYVASLMGRVAEPGKFANWIAPPARGINNQPVDFAYVRFN